MNILIFLCLMMLNMSLILTIKEKQTQNSALGEITSEFEWISPMATGVLFTRKYLTQCSSLPWIPISGNFNVRIFWLTLSNALLK